MKMMYNGTQIKSLNIKHYEIDSNFATVEPSDMQAGKTAVARGKKITGTGKSFEFASYGDSPSNLVLPLPNAINVIQISSIEYPIKQMIAFEPIRNTDFTTTQVIAEVEKDGVCYPINVQVNNNILTLTCELTFNVLLFYGKDNYV